MATAIDIRQSAQFVGFAVVALAVRGVLWVLGILWNIVKEIVNGVFRMVVGIVVVILSVIALFGFILWLFTL